MNLAALTKADGDNSLEGVSHLSIGVAWDSSKRGKKGILGRILKEVGVDLDLAAVLYQDDVPVRVAIGDNPDPLKDGSVVHSGDNTTGAGEGDDETITADFTRVSKGINKIVYEVVAYKPNVDFATAQNVDVTVYDSSGGTATAVANIMPSLEDGGNAIVVAKAEKINGSWFLTVINKTGRITPGDQKSLLRLAKLNA